ncbi:MAG: hypothetical protein J6K61_02750 [Clostridia bacterium]|nr:hypothetical protein [Clostridia bacterium]
MATSIIIGGASCLLMICGVLFFPQIRLGKVKLDSYWVIVLLGACAMLLSGQVGLGFLKEQLFADSAINPFKILVLFISMTVLSIFLDEVGFFRYLANLTLKKAKKSQFTLFAALFVTVAVLTAFTSNDIIVLTFTPFICYFAKNAKISPIPYLVTEFIVANTLSMVFIIGNPTNIYIGTSYGVTFLDYLLVMFWPTMAAAAISFLVLWLLFRKELKKVPEVEDEDVKIENKPFLIIGLVLLSVCTVALAVGSYIGLEMWAISLASALLLFLIIGILSLAQRRKPKELLMCAKRAPWELIPFVLSMFVIILALSENGVTDKIASLLGQEHIVWKYGVTSFLSANLINNIPMSVLFCSVMSGLEGASLQAALYASVVGSNLGAFLTPIGALAGIMWSSLLKEHRVRFGYIDFIKYGTAVSLPALFVTLLVLCFVL